MKITFIAGGVQGVQCDCNYNDPHVCSNAPLVRGPQLIHQSVDMFFCDCACHNAHWLVLSTSGALLHTDVTVPALGAYTLEDADAHLDRQAGYLGVTVYQHHAPPVPPVLCTPPSAPGFDLHSVMLAYLMG